MTGIRTLDDIESFIRLADDAATLNELRSLLQREIDRLGFHQYTYWLLWPPDGPRFPLYMTNYPAEWTKHYTSHDFKSHDLVINHSASTVRPFLWEQLREHYAISKTQNAVFGDAREFGLKVGGSIPVHGPRNAHACFTVSSDLSPESFRDLFKARQHELHLIAVYTHERVLQLGLKDPDALPQLTARELEVLTWTAKGKTRWEIGEILRISEDTVKKHLLTASNRLGVSNKTHAVSKALLHRLIIP